MKKNVCFFREMSPGMQKLLNVMKLTTILLLISVFGVFANNSYSQSKVLNLKLRNTTVKEVLKNIEEQSEFYFMYSEKLVDVSREVSVTAKNQKIDAVLNELFAGTDVSYTVKDRFILLTTPEVGGADAAAQQQNTISGTITDEAGQPLPGVTVIVKGTTHGTVTGADGKYTLTEIPTGATLQFSFVGMKTQEVQVGTQTTIDIVLAADAIGLEEVVAIGYGTMKKSDLTGSVSSVSMEALEQKTITAVDQALQGVAAGVMASAVSGEPGAGMNIRIRGISSFSNASEPLYVIDGVPVLVNSDYTFSSSSNPLASLNPGDIQSIEILKDASATSIYGSRGSNGVVLITTKKGKGEAKVVLNTSYTSQSLINKIDVATGPELANLIEEFRSTLGWDPLFDGSEIYYPALSNIKNYDYQDLLFRTAPIVTTDLSISGGNDQTKYFISGNFMDQEGIMLETGFKRYGFRANLEQKVSEKFTISVNSSLSRTINEKPTVNVQNLVEYPSFLPVYDESGNYLHNRFFADVPYSNPVASAKEQNVTEYIDRSMTSLTGEYQIYKDLKLTVRGSYDLSNMRADNFITPKHISGENTNGRASVSNRKVSNVILSTYLTYNKEINNDISVNATGGYEFQEYIVEGSSLSGQDFGSASQGVWGMSSAGQDNRGIGTSKNQKNLVGYFGRLNLNIKDKYMITANARADGSSVFAENNKWGFFPSGAFAWRVSEEGFMQDVAVVNNLKLRVSYGATGNGEIPLYQSQALWSLNANPAGYNTVGGWVIQPAFGGNTASDLAATAYVNRIANPDLKWERTNQFDVGVDVGILDGKLEFTADYYHKKTVDAIIPRAIPKTTGFQSALMNIGSLLNEGVELSMTAYPIEGEFSWKIGGNVTFMHQTPLDLSDNDYIYASAHGGRDSQLGLRMELNKPSGLLWGFVFDGVWDSQEEIDNRTTTNHGLLGDYKAVDINGDNVLDANDKTYVGRALPSITYGINNTLSYKNFNLDFFIQGVHGNDTQINYWNNLLGMSVEFPNNVSREYLNNYWKPGSTNAKYAGISGAKAGTIRPWETNSNSVFDASYIRLKSVTLSYDLKVQNQNIFDSAKIYLTGENLVTITDYPGYNPDVASLGLQAFNAGYDNGGYPAAKKITLGLSVTF
ncbi:TonB-dependent receptor [uncultured Draconibacterium sp.]|uniref:TonB-dependent receptor n=1 Tax=uncultured Draconibacterium sp. TaxID=1573823 RepID=UPI003260E4E3